MAAGPLHVTLVADVVTPLTVDVATPASDVRSFATPIRPRVEVLNVDGAGEVYFTANGVDPTVGGDGCHVLPAAIGSIEVYDETPGPTSDVRLISSGTPKVSVRAL